MASAPEETKKEMLGADAAAVAGARSASESDAASHAAPTKGPWVVRWYYTDFGNYAIEGELNVARTFSIGDEAEELANAHLISAAPDYDAAARKHLARHDGEALATGFDRCGCETCNLFRPIVAKAEGRS